jgi:hypothetical protein
MQSDPARLALLRRWAVLLDSAFKVPGLPVRFGLETIVGLVPGIGDLATPAFTVLVLATGVRMRVPFLVLVRMAMNAGIDALIGLVPLLGDLVDVAWKANLRNLDLLERHAVPGTRRRRVPADRARRDRPLESGRARRLCADPPGVNAGRRDGRAGVGASRGQPGPSRARRAARIFANERSSTSSGVRPVRARSATSIAPQLSARRK